ncbi:MAG TPA: hypothetical protein GXZ87_01440 [Bacteroidales bacterium]|nr:hypothetical protein [Bacteroidales bacterium]
MENAFDLHQQESKFIFKGCFLSVFFIFISLFAFPQGEKSFIVHTDYYTRFQNISTRDGLSNNTVLGMVQDYNGMMWFATMNGLNRFDGYNFTVYKHQTDNPNSLSDNFVTCIELDKYGNLWIGTANGLNCYNRETNSFTRFFQSDKGQSISNNYIRALLADKDGYLWIETRAASCDRMDIQKKTFTRIPHKNGEFEGNYYYHQIFKDSKNNIWIGGRCFLPLMIKNSNPNKIVENIPIRGTQFLDLNSYVETTEGKIIGFGLEKKMFVFDKAKNEFNKIEGITLSGNPCRAVIDKKDKIWVGGYNGLQVIDLKRKTATSFFNQPMNDFSIPSNTIYFVYKDKDENIWLGTNQGVGFYSEKWNYFRHYRQLFGNEKSLSSNHISALMQDKDGLLWVGTEENGVDTVSFRNEVFGNIKYNILNQKIDEKTFLREREIFKDYFLRELIKCSDKSRTSESIFKNFRSFKSAPLTFSTANENIVTTVYQDSRGKIYIGTYSGTGFNVYDKNTKQLKRYSLQGFKEPDWVSPYIESPVGGNWYKQFLEDDRNRLWAVTWESLGLNLFDRDKEHFDGKHFFPTRKLIFPTLKMHLDEKHKRMWMKMGHYLGYYDFNEKQFHRFVPKLAPNSPNYDIHQRYYPYLKCDLVDLPFDFIMLDFAFDKNGNVWLLSPRNLVKMQISNLTTEVFSFPVTNTTIISNYHNLMIFNDDYSTLWFSNENEFYKMSLRLKKFERLNSIGIEKITHLHKIGNNIWIAAKNGIWIFNTQNNSFKPIEKGHFRDNQAVTDVTYILTDRKGNIWIGCQQGLIKMEKGKETERYLFDNKQLPGSLISYLYFDHRNQLWIGTNNGLAMLNPENNKSTIFLANPHNKYALIDNYIRSISEDFEHNIRLSTEKGFCKYEPKTGRFIDLSEPDDDCISSRLGSCLMQDKNGNLWYGTTDKGLNRIDAVTEKTTHYIHHAWDSTGISSNNVTCLHQDKKGRIWVGTDKGLNLYDEANHQFTHFTSENGLPDNNLMSIQEDNKGNLWLSTTKGLCCFNPDSSTYRTFYRAHGLCDDEFSFASCKMQDGNLTFGSYNGFVIFNPDSLSKNWEAFPAVLYDFFVNDSLRFPTVNNKQKITLKYSENSFTVNFTSPDFAYAKTLKYRFCLQGFDQNWQYVNAKTRGAKYTNLRWGRYTLLVEVSNPFGEFNNKPTEIFILIKTPWFVSWWFILLCVGMLTLAIYWYIWYREKKLKAENLRLENTVKERTAELQETNEKLSISEENLQKELDTKDKFFSIISHDLRNPSRSMSQMADLLYQRYETLDKAQAEEFLRLLADTAKNNSQLIEKLLYWAVTQQQDFSAKSEAFDIYDIIESVKEQLKSEAELKKVTIKATDCKSIQVFADKNMTEMVLRNLVSNAIKYSFENGEIIIATDEKSNEVAINVTDFGIGMEQHEVEKLFKLENKLKKQGTNGEQGTGLGLILCAEFVKKNNGKIFAESVKNTKTMITFTIQKSPLMR